MTFLDSFWAAWANVGRVPDQFGCLVRCWRPSTSSPLPEMLSRADDEMAGLDGGQRPEGSTRLPASWNGAHEQRVHRFSQESGPYSQIKDQASVNFSLVILERYASRRLSSKKTMKCMTECRTSHSGSKLFNGWTRMVGQSKKGRLTHGLLHDGCLKLKLPGAATFSREECADGNTADCLPLNSGGKTNSEPAICRCSVR